MRPAPRLAGIVPALVLTFDTAAGTLANRDVLPDRDVSGADFDEAGNPTRHGGVPGLSRAVLTVSRSISITHNVSIVRGGQPASAELVAALPVAGAGLPTVPLRRPAHIDQPSTALS